MKLQTIVFSFVLSLVPALTQAATTTHSPGSLKVVPVLGATSFDLKGIKSNGSVPTGGTSMRSGVMAGALVAYELDFWEASLETGLVYMETGSEIDAFFAKLETSIAYLSVPINVRAPVFSMGSMPVHAKVGIIPSLLVSASVEGSGFASGKTDIKDDLNSFDLMAQLGLGGRYNINDQMQLLIDLAYLRGFLEVDKNGGGYNQGLSLAAALSISI